MGLDDVKEFFKWGDFKMEAFRLNEEVKNKVVQNTKNVLKKKE